MLAVVELFARAWIFETRCATAQSFSCFKQNWRGAMLGKPNRCSHSSKATADDKDRCAHAIA
jgi:hypothetical protein